MAKKFNLAELMGEAVSKSDTGEMQVEQIPLTEIEENENNSYAQNDIDELAESIKVIGLQQPLVVRRKTEGGYLLLAGHRRRNALALLDRKTVPCIVLDADLDPSLQVLPKACPLFVPLVEEGLWEDPVTDEIAKRYLSELIDIDIDTLILGCTHYPLIRSTVGRVMGDQVTLVNPAYETARELKGLLQHYHILNDEEPHLGENKYQFYVSDGAEKFKHFANSIIKYGILSAKTIKIDEY